MLGILVFCIYFCSFIIFAISVAIFMAFVADFASASLFDFCPAQSALNATSSSFRAFASLAFSGSFFAFVKTFSSYASKSHSKCASSALMLIFRSFLCVMRLACICEMTPFSCFSVAVARFIVLFWITPFAKSTCASPFR